jgi:hypothetical protein
VEENAGELSFMPYQAEVCINRLALSKNLSFAADMARSVNGCAGSVFLLQ